MNTNTKALTIAASHGQPPTSMFALIGFTFMGWIGWAGIVRRYTLAVVASSVATRIRRDLLPVYDNRRRAVSRRLKEGRWLCTFHAKYSIK